MVQVTSILALIDGHKTAVMGDLLCVPGSVQAALTTKLEFLFPYK